MLRTGLLIANSSAFLLLIAAAVNEVLTYEGSVAWYAGVFLLALLPSLNAWYILRSNEAKVIRRWLDGKHRHIKKTSLFQG